MICCVKCGVGAPEGSQFCNACGAKQGKNGPFSGGARNGQQAEKIRDEFASIFLWGALYIFGISGGAILMFPNPFGFMIFNFYGGLLVATAVCVFFILRWRKKAFYCLFAMAVAAGLITGLFFTDLGMEFGNGFILGGFIMVVFIAILFGVLQIRNRFDKSTWAQLE